MNFDAYAVLARIRAGEPVVAANPANPAKREGERGCRLAALAALAAPTGSNSENGDALETAIDAAQERAGILEYDAGLARTEAEHTAAEAAAERWGVSVATILGRLQS